MFWTELVLSRAEMRKIKKLKCVNWQQKVNIEEGVHLSEKDILQKNMEKFETMENTGR